MTEKNDGEYNRVDFVTKKIFNTKYQIFPQKNICTKLSSETKNAESTSR